MRTLRVVALSTVALLVLALAGVGFAVTVEGHAPLHIGCTHHSHGPKWHAGHGRAIGASASRFRTPDAAAGLEDRGVTAGR